MAIVTLLASLLAGAPRLRYPNERLVEPGDHRVDVPVVCVITRFGLRSPRYLLPMYLNYRRVARDTAGTPGLLRSAFLVEAPTACYTLSIWATPDAIPIFGTAVPSHVEAGRKGFGWVWCREGRGPELWSTKWTLTSVSNNLNWDDFDLREHIVNYYAD